MITISYVSYCNNCYEIFQILTYVFIYLPLHILEGTPFPKCAFGSTPLSMIGQTYCYAIIVG